MLLNLLESTNNNNGNNGGWVIWVIFGVAIIAMIIMNHFSNKKRRAQMEAEKEKRNAIQAGYKVVTIGGIVGTVVEVNNEANTFVLKTGSEECPSYLTFDKVAIYTAEDPNAQTEEVAEEPVEEPTEEVPFEEENADAPTEENAETSTEETTSEEETEEKAE